ncbi:MAG: hypothetical protein ACI9HK_000659 [Pirellulaceae bacterium]|jgi:hypothetical protein
MGPPKVLINLRMSAKSFDCSVLGAKASRLACFYCKSQHLLGEECESTPLLHGDLGLESIAKTAESRKASCRAEKTQGQADSAF